MPTQAERTASTRSKILDAARSSFVSRGYDGTTIADVLDAAAVSKGALYHHFESKQAIAEAIFSDTSRHAITAASRRARDVSDPVETLVQGCLLWLEEVSEPSVAVVMFDIGPTALGWERCRQIEAANSIRALRLGIARAVEAGAFAAARADLAAHTINAVLGELAWLSVRSDGADVDDVATTAVVRAMIHALAQIDRPADLRT
ncbi:MAG: helix-turn-helix domain-containing protein [Actinomycetota bacterium]